MKKIFFVFAFLSIAVLLNSCSNDVKLLAPYKETTVVYGLLNQSLDTNYIRIEKGYLGNGNALTMAQVADSINYPANQLTVTLTASNTSLGTSTTYTLTPTNSIQKNTGTFAAPAQTLYQMPVKLDSSNQYNLTIINNKTGHTVTSQTNLVNGFTLLSPSSGTTTIALTNNVYPYRTKWLTAANGRVYQLSIRFYYSEKNISSGVTTQKYVDWSFASQTSQDLIGGEPMETDFFANSFFQYLGNVIPVNSNVQRTAGAFVFNFTVGSDDFNTYLEVTAPSLGINQAKPTFSDLTNGLGLFTSRYTTSISVELTTATLDTLSLGQYTKNLGF
ncbi:MAG: hypothetical protein ABI199_03885 [Bacteroidia bacterium]